MAVRKLREQRNMVPDNGDAVPVAWGGAVISA